MQNPNPFFAAERNFSLWMNLPRRIPSRSVIATRTALKLADYVVTEFGVARLRGKTLRERAEALRAVAHPSFQDDLT